MKICREKEKKKKIISFGKCYLNLQKFPFNLFYSIEDGKNRQRNLSYSRELRFKQIINKKHQHLHLFLCYIKEKVFKFPMISFSCFRFSIYSVSKYFSYTEHIIFAPNKSSFRLAKKN